METPHKSFFSAIGPETFVICLILLGALIFGYTKYHALQVELAANGHTISDLQTNLDTERSENDTLTQQLQITENTNSAYQGQIAGISNTLGTLQKLNTLDPELLEKYSKVFFLNENYVPKSLSPIDTQYLFDPNKPQQIETDVKPFLQNLLGAALSNNVPMEVVSAYRSFDTQAALKSEYKVTYGSGANSFSADQGYSEHQLGTAVDLTTTDVGGALTGFEKSSAYTWLMANAYQYGFELSYPADNSYYVFEPWHWRFVGIKLATYLHDHNENFYDMDQRDINAYLINIFDK